MTGSLSRLPVRRFVRQELAELARWEAVSCRHGWSVGEGVMSPVEIDDDDGVEYVSVYLAAVTGGPVYFVKAGFGAWAVVDGRGDAKRFGTLRAALEFICPTAAARPFSGVRQAGAVIVKLPTPTLRPTTHRPTLLS